MTKQRAITILENHATEIVAELAREKDEEIIQLMEEDLEVLEMAIEALKS